MNALPRVAAPPCARATLAADLLAAGTAGSGDVMTEWPPAP